MGVGYALSLALLLVSGAQAEQEGRMSPRPRVAVRISFPSEAARVRGNVPVYGVAACPDFRRYRVEFGAGREPEHWHLLRISGEPALTDPYTSRTVRWHPRTGGKGNLATWQTGLDEYPYGEKYERNLHGVYTLRLVVEDTRGRTFEDRVTVVVGRVITNASGGRAYSPDGRVEAKFPPEGIPRPFLVVSLLPTNQVRVPQDYTICGPIYEFRPPNLSCLHPVTLTMRYGEEDVTPRLHAWLDDWIERGSKPGLDEGRIASPTQRDGVPTPSKLAIYEFQPVDEIWRRLESTVNTEARQVSTEIIRVSRYVAYLALLGDVRAPDAPVLHIKEAASAYHGRKAGNGSATKVSVGRITVEARAEPYARIALRSRPLSHSWTANCDTDGIASFTGLELKEGLNVFTAEATDGAGNTSQPSAPVHVALERRGPRKVYGLRILGTTDISTGDRCVVCARGQDQDPDHANSCLARVHSTVTDSEGFDLELVETTRDSGIYVGILKIAAATDIAKSQLGARCHNEVIEARVRGVPSRRATIAYVDRSPPGCPEILCPTHPSVCQDTFEADPVLGNEWQERDSPYGGRIVVRSEISNRYLEVWSQSPGHRNSLGVWCRRTPYAASQFPVLGFDYRMMPGARADLAITPGGRWRGPLGVALNDDHPCYPRMGKVCNFRADYTWRHAEARLGMMLARACRETSEHVVNAVSIIDVDCPDFMRRTFGSQGGNYLAYSIDNFRVLAYSQERNAVFEFRAADHNGIAAYSYALDHRANTQPDETPEIILRPVGPENAGNGPHHRKETLTSDTWQRARYSNLEDGRWHFHVRAQDGAGNWGRANHYMIVVDTRPPIMNLAALGDRPVWPLGSHPGSDLPVSVPWRTPVRVQLHDHGGSGVQPENVVLEIAGRRYHWASGGFDFIPSRNPGEMATIHWAPGLVSPTPVIFPEDYRVGVRLISAPDGMGREYVVADGEVGVGTENGGIVEPETAAPDRPTASRSGCLAFSYTVKSPLRVTPANPDGKKGWYVSEPRIGFSAGPQEETKCEERWDWGRSVDGEGHAVVREYLVTIAPRLPEDLRPGPTESLPAHLRPTTYAFRLRVDRKTPATKAAIISAKTREVPSAGKLIGDQQGSTLRPSQPRGQDHKMPSATQSVPHGAAIRLSHDDYVWEAGGLMGTYFKTPELSEPIVSRADPLIDFTTRDPQSTEQVPGARSARWEGLLWMDSPQECELEAVISARDPVTTRLWVDGETVFHSEDEGVPWSIKSKVYLSRGMHRLKLEYSNSSGSLWWLQLFWWRKDRDWRELIPADCLFYRRPVATIFFRLDDGPVRQYETPFAVPPGKHTLYFHAEDEAGHVENENTLQLHLSEASHE